MSQKMSEENRSENCSKPTKQTITLNPIRTDGPDSLLTHDTPGLEHAKLSELQLASTNNAHGITIRKADDLFAAHSNDTDFIPSGTTITSATIDVKIENAPHPHKCTLHPPDQVLLESPSDKPVIMPWLQKRHFLQIAAACLVAVASAMAPAFDDDSLDDDDLATDHLTQPA